MQLRFYALTGDLPPRRSAWDDSGARRRRLRARVPRAARARQARRRRCRSGSASPPRCAIVAERAAAGELTVDAGRGGARRRADRILEKRRWMLARGGTRQ